MDEFFTVLWYPFSTNSVKVAKVEPEMGQGFQKDTKIKPKGVKMKNQGLPN